ncbi:MAG: Bax inhibitor-1 family protein [Lachnospiraceae bacterium]|nr:Bax inhibitor-1 family protein [Lachnospiraceae bacterium]
MSSMTSDIRAERLKQIVDENKVVSTRTFNIVMGGVVLYGLVINAILCNFSSQIAMFLNPIVLLIGYLVLSIVGIMISRKSSNAFVSFLGYNMICVPLGLVISVMVEVYGGISSRPVQMAFIYTIGITVIMILAAVAFPKVFEGIGKALFVALIAIAIVGILSMFIQGMQFIYSILGAGLFSLYIGYDFYRSQQFAKTVDNAVDCAIDIYLDIANLFLFLLRIFGRSD